MHVFLETELSFFPAIIKNFENQSRFGCYCQNSISRFSDMVYIIYNQSNNQSINQSIHL